MAYMLLMALVAAIRPKSNGSSTMGTKKSVVLITPSPLPKSITAASSLLELSTKRLGNSGRVRLVFKIRSRIFDEILHSLPAPRLHSVMFYIFHWFHLRVNEIPALLCPLYSFIQLSLPPFTPKRLSSRCFAQITE